MIGKGSGSDLLALDSRYRYLSSLSPADFCRGGSYSLQKTSISGYHLECFTVIMLFDILVYTM